MDDEELPTSITIGADLRGNEYGWAIDSFPDALAKAEALGYACLGGQFQFRMDDGIYEAYWLSADSAERRPGEAWCAYGGRSCAEVAQRFQERVREVDFKKEALAWTAVRQRIEQGFDPLRGLVFVGYFITEAEWLRDQSARNNV
jgi:hypothetical protein